MLGTLHHFKPGDRVAHAEMPELERLMLHQLAEQAAIVRKAYAEFDYKTVVASLSAFMNTELSAFYFDIRKDTLYCDPPSSLARKAALTTIDILCDAILKWLAPVLSFTCEEAWRLYRPDAEPSVHLTLFPESFETFRDDALATKWETIRNVRRVVTGALEVERAAKNIGSSLEASPLVYVSDNKIFDTLFDIDLAEVSITSNAMVTNDDAPSDAFRLNEVPGVAVVVEKAVGTKCARSWKILPTVGEDAEYPDVSPRDAQALREWKALNPASVPPATPDPAPVQAVDAVAAEPEPVRVVVAVVAAPEISVQQDIETKPVEAAVPKKRKPAKSRSKNTTDKTAQKSSKKSDTTGSKKAAAKKKAAKKAVKQAAAMKGVKKKTAKKQAAKKVAKKAAKKKPAKKTGKTTPATKAKKKKKKKAR
jgi:isoleucyl-tRNA synthetase